MASFIVGGKLKRVHVACEEKAYFKYSNLAILYSHTKPSNSILWHFPIFNNLSGESDSQHYDREKLFHSQQGLVYGCTVVNVHN